MVKTSRYRRLKLGEPKIYFLDQLINFVLLLMPINFNKTTTFVSLISRFVGEKIRKLSYFSENAGFLGYTMSTALFDRTMILLPYLWRKGRTHINRFGSLQ